MLANERSILKAYVTFVISSIMKLSSSFLQTLCLEVVERGEDELLHTRALGKALRALTSLTNLKLEWKWDPGEFGACDGNLEILSEAITLMPELRFACSLSYAYRQ